MFWSKWKLGQVLHSSINLDDKAVVLSVSSSSWLSIRNHQHGLHGQDHARLEDGVNIFPQLQSRLSTIIMRDHAEAVAVLSLILYPL